MNTDTFFLFPPFALDVRNQQLWRGAQAVALRPKTFAVLRHLISQAGQLVTTDTLLEAVWGPTAVSETVVRSSIREIRTTLGDTAQHPQFIQTMHRRGYRFIAPVTVAHTPPPALASTAAATPRPPPPSTPDADTVVHPPTELTLDEEYKLVTILCCAVTDASTLAVHRGPESMYRLMQAFFAVVQEVIQRYDGTLTHVTGEGFTAVFGAPVGQEDHARRAVLAALELGQHLRAQPLGEAHVAAMGLHTGPVVVGHLTLDPQRFYSAVGDTMHQALRLQRLATPGTILMSATTYRLVQAEIRVEDTAVAASDGRRSIAVYMVQGLMQRRAGVAGQGTRLQSRFVGRTRELALLHARLAHAAQGYGQVVGIAGEPGIGKSRLLVEFRQNLVGQPVTYREGHCLPYSIATPYLPVRDLLRQGCGITETDGVASITVKVQQALENAHLLPEDEAPLLLQLLDVPVDDAWLARLSPQERRIRTFALLRHLVVHDSRRRPLILTVENLHWVDAMSEAWLTALVEHLPGAAILLLVTHRPGCRPPWLEHSIATQIALPRLLPQDSRAVVQSVLQGTTLPAPLLQTIITKGAGNPFFLEEITWAILGQRPLATEPGTPDTIQAVLAARIRSAPPGREASPADRRSPRH